MKTLAEFQAMSSAQLDLLAATGPMGWKDCGTDDDYSCWHDGKDASADIVWRPTADRNQSGQLLEKMVSLGCGFVMTIGSDETPKGFEDFARVDGVSPRAEVIACLMAWQSLHA